MSDRAALAGAMPSRAKQILMLGLVSCFAVQGYLVYRDPSSGVKLAGAALHGARLWHRHNCQTCHQLYGFGGFLGPDLTNVALRLGGRGLRQRLALVLRQGSGQMPSFDVDAREIAALGAFLVEMNRTGYGQLRVPAAGAPAAATRFEAAVTAELAGTATTAVRAGFAAFRRRACRACHAPLVASPAGAPDLSRASARLDRQALHEVLSNGRMPGMPPPSPALSGREREQLIAFLDWLGARRAALSARLERGARRRFAWSDVPWWEYR